MLWMICNYATNHLIKSAFIGGLTTTVCLFGDLAILYYRNKLDNQDYITKKAQLDEEMADLKGPGPQNSAVNQISILEGQLKALDDKKKIQEGALSYNLKAAAFLGSGYGASVLFAAVPIVAASAYLVCYVAIGMYLSAGAYTEKLKKEQALRIEAAFKRSAAKGPMNPHVVIAAQKDAEMAHNDFCMSLARNTLIPFLWTTVCLVSSSAGLAFVTGYLAYELYRWNAQLKTKDEIETLAATPMAPAGARA
jgi:hypothetical protein